MAFPASLPSFTNPTGTDELADAIGGLTHAQMHAAENDAIEEIAGALTAGSLTATSHTPTFNLAYGSVVPTVGAGSATGWYVTVGPLFVWCFRFVFGSGATTGTGIYGIDPPVSALASGLGGHGKGTVINSSSQTLSVTYEMFNGSIAGLLPTSANAYLAPNSPTGIGTNGTAINGTLIGRRA